MLAFLLLPAVAIDTSAQNTGATYQIYAPAHFNPAFPATQTRASAPASGRHCAPNLAKQRGRA